MRSKIAFIHGSGYLPNSFDQQVAAFAGSVALALPGHPDGDALESVSDMARFVHARLDLERGERAVVGGNSLGGAVSLRWALEYPRSAQAIILIGTGARLRVAPSIFTLIETRWPACIPELVDMAISTHAPAWLREQSIRSHECVGQENTRRDFAACNAFDVMAELDRLQLPALIVVGSDDRMTPPKYSQYLHQHIAGSELKVIHEAAHLVMAERPAEVNAAIATFIARVQS